jgi:tRNA dimethylallyltransferase
VNELAVLVGPTAAGKSTLAVALAERLDGEVVSADAFAVYRGLDIGTAKPAPVERQRVPHHLIDVADPRERYSAGMFARDADAAIADIRARGRTPVVVGGTMFYVRTLLRGLFPEPPRDEALRRALEEEWRRDPAALRTRLAALDPEAAARLAPTDRQRVLRAIEVATVAGRPMTALWREHPLADSRYRARILGCAPPRADLHATIAARVGSMFARGLLDEVRGLLAAGVPREAHALKAIGYRECVRVLDGEWTVEQARERTAAATRQLAKRQLTWLRGMAGVEWLAGTGAAAVAAAVGRLEAERGTEPGAC